MAHLFLTVAALLISAVLAAASWNTVPVSEPYVPRPESSFTLCGGNKLCLLGGRGSDPVSILDTKSLSWSKGKNPPQEIHHFQALQGPDNCAWVVGAWTGAYPTESTVDNILKYCPDTDQWSTGPAIERPRGAGGAVLYDGAVYLVSGNVGGHNINANLVTWFDKLDLETGKWSQLPDVPNPRDHFHAVVVGSKLYVAGGRDSTGNEPDFFEDVETKVDVFDFDSQKWSTLDDFPRPRGGTFAAALDAQVFVLGGEGQGRAWAEVDVLDGTLFKPAEDMPGPRHGAGAVLCNGAIWVAGGVTVQGGGKEASDTIAYYDGDKPPLCGAPETTSPTSTPSTTAPTTTTATAVTSTLTSTSTSISTTAPLTTAPVMSSTETTTTSPPLSTVTTEAPMTSTTAFSPEPALSFAPSSLVTPTPLIGPIASSEAPLFDEPFPSDEAVPSDEPFPSDELAFDELPPSDQPPSDEEDTSSNVEGSEGEPGGTSEGESEDPSGEESGEPADGSGSGEGDESGDNEDTESSPSEEPSEPACFPSDAVVELRDGTLKTMAELRIGDHVKVAPSGEYSPIYFFSHRHSKSVDQFVKISTSVRDVSLSVSGGHLIYANGRRVPARTVRVGDEISISHKTAKTATVTATTRIESNGLHNPHTLHGDIIVNGVLASTFTSTVHPSVAQLLLFPFRMAYKVAGAHNAVERLNHAVLRTLDYCFWGRH